MWRGEEDVGVNFISLSPWMYVSTNDKVGAKPLISLFHDHVINIPD